MEVIVSLFVITVGIVAAIGLLTKSVSNSINSRNQIIAAQLAQEGVELVRNIRDNNIADSEDAFLGLGIMNDKCIDVSADANYFTLNNPNLECLDGHKLYYNSGNFTYIHSNCGDNCTETGFFRKIDIEPYPPPPASDSNFRLVKSTVIWTGTDSFPPSCTTSTKCTEAQAILEMEE